MMKKKKPVKPKAKKTMPKKDKSGVTKGAFKEVKSRSFKK